METERPVSFNVTDASGNGWSGRSVRIADEPVEEEFTAPGVSAC